MKSNKEKKIAKILSMAGIKINGNNSWDIQINDNRVYEKVLAQGSLGFGESYINGWWSSKRLDKLLFKILTAKLDDKINGNYIFWEILKAKIINMQNKVRSFEVGRKHYDIGNKLYKYMLDKRMVYTCGYWKNSKDLDSAQENKLDLVCKKIGLKPGMNVLDIGCGWGSFAKFAAEKYKVKVVGITISKEQVKLGNELCRGLPVKIKLQDYRDLNEKFDRIVSLGMFEHVGYKNYREYMNVVSRCLKNNGLFLLHTIGGNNSVKSTDPWISKYIFPNSMLPSAKQITSASEGFFILEDWHNFGKDYDKTLMSWYKNFKNNWNKIKDSYNDEFKRMWEYYLLSCAASFRSDKNQLWQIVFSKNGVKKGYKTVR